MDGTGEAPAEGVLNAQFFERGGNASRYCVLVVRHPLTARYGANLPAIAGP